MCFERCAWHKCVMLWGDEQQKAPDTYNETTAQQRQYHKKRERARDSASRVFDIYVNTMVRHVRVVMVVVVVGVVDATSYASSSTGGWNGGGGCEVCVCAWLVVAPSGGVSWVLGKDVGWLCRDV